MTKINMMRKLPPHLEAQFPKEFQEFREFYFQLSDEEKAKLDNPDSKKENLTELPGYIKILKKLNKEIEEKKNIKSIPKVTKFCFECGKKINRSAKYCEECGTEQPEL